MTCIINKTTPMDLRETLLIAVKDMSGLLCVSTSADYAKAKLLCPEFISSIANDISLLTEVAMNIEEGQS